MKGVRSVNKKPYWLPGGREKYLTASRSFTEVAKRLGELIRDLYVIWHDLRLQLEDVYLLALYPEREEVLDRARQELLRAYQSFLSRCEEILAKLRSPRRPTISPSPN
jgi:hypothetical protein